MNAFAYYDDPYLPPRAPRPPGTPAPTAHPMFSWCRACCTRARTLESSCTPRGACIPRPPAGAAKIVLVCLVQGEFRRLVFSTVVTSPRLRKPQGVVFIHTHCTPSVDRFFFFCSGSRAAPAARERPRGRALRSASDRGRNGEFWRKWVNFGKGKFLKSESASIGYTT